MEGACQANRQRTQDHAGLHPTIVVKIVLISNSILEETKILFLAIITSDA